MSFITYLSHVLPVITALFICVLMVTEDTC